MKKSLGNKRKEVSESQAHEIFEIYESFEEGEFSKIYPNKFFGYTKVIVEQPLVEEGVVKTDRNGNPKPDVFKRNQERVPLSDSVEEYYEREVQPHLPDSWLDRSKDRIGYEINFTKYFYKFIPLRSLEEIIADLQQIDMEIEGLSRELVSG